jgi:hypothetical protein
MISIVGRCVIVEKSSHFREIEVVKTQININLNIGFTHSECDPGFSIHIVKGKIFQLY